MEGSVGSERVVWDVHASGDAEAWEITHCGVTAQCLAHGNEGAVCALGCGPQTIHGSHHRIVVAVFAQNEETLHYSIWI